MTKGSSAVLLLFLACFTSNALGNPFLYNQQAPTPNQTVSYWFACARGAL